MTFRGKVLEYDVLQGDLKRKTPLSWRAKRD